MPTTLMNANIIPAVNSSSLPILNTVKGAVTGVSLSKISSRASSPLRARRTQDNREFDVPFNGNDTCQCVIARNARVQIQGGILYFPNISDEYVQTASSETEFVNDEGKVYTVKIRPQQLGKIQTLIHRWNDVENQRCFGLSLTATNGLSFSFSGDGSSSASANSTTAIAGIAVNTWIWLRVTHLLGGTVTFEQSSDGVAWTAIGTPVSVVSILGYHDSTAPITINSYNDGGISSALAFDGELEVMTIDNFESDYSACGFSTTLLTQDQATWTGYAGERWVLNSKGYNAILGSNSFDSTSFWTLYGGATRGATYPAPTRAANEGVINLSKEAQGFVFSSASLNTYFGTVSSVRPRLPPGLTYRLTLKARCLSGTMTFYLTRTDGTTFTGSSRSSAYTATTTWQTFTFTYTDGYAGLRNSSCFHDILIGGNGVNSPSDGTLIVADASLVLDSVTHPYVEGQPRSVTPPEVRCVGLYDAAVTKTGQPRAWFGTGSISFPSITLSADFSISFKTQFEIFGSDSSGQCIGGTNSRFGARSPTQIALQFDDSTEVTWTVPTLTINKIYEIDVERAGSTITLFIDGESIGTTTSSAALTIDRVGFGRTRRFIGTVYQLAISTTIPVRFYEGTGTAVTDWVDSISAQNATATTYGTGIANSLCYLQAEGYYRPAINFVQTTAASQPVLWMGMGVITPAHKQTLLFRTTTSGNFGAVTMSLVATGYVQYDSFSLCTVIAPNATTASEITMLGNRFDSSAGFSIGHNSSLSNIFGWFGSSQTALGASSLTMNQVQLVVATVANGVGTSTGVITRNNTTTATNTVAYAMGISISTLMTLGVKMGAAGGDDYYGRISEVIAYPRVLSATEQTKIYNSTKKRWSVP